VLKGLAHLPQEVEWSYRVIGDGPEFRRLRALARALDLDRVEFAGTLTPARVVVELDDADIFVLGLRQSSDGDRDGVPNAVLEAMARALPVISCDGGGIGEVIQHGRTGWLAPANDAAALAQLIAFAAAHPRDRRRVGERAHAEVRRRFGGDVSPSPLGRYIHAASVRA